MCLSYTRLRNFYWQCERLPSVRLLEDTRQNNMQEKKRKQFAQLSVSLPAGRFCDCTGCEGSVHDGSFDLSNYTESDAPSLLRACRRNFGDLQRSRRWDDGHLDKADPRVKSVCLREAWESGLIDLTWRC